MLIAEERKVELAAQVRRLLAGANIPRTDFAKVLCDVLGIAIAQSYRKLNGNSDYTLPQIAALEERFGVTLIHVVVEETAPPPGTRARHWTDAVLHVEGQQVACRVVVGAALRAESKRPFAAYLERGHWNVCLAVNCKELSPLFEVERLLCNHQSAGSLGHGSASDSESLGPA